MKLLLIDDDPRVIRTLSRLLKDDYIIDTAVNAETAEDLAYFNHYDIIILDLVLPDMDGEDLCALIKARVKNVPILVISGKETVSDKDLAFRKGADDYLTKPFDIKELKSRMNVLIRRSMVGDTKTLEDLTLRGISIDRLRRKALYKKERLSLRKKELLLLEFLLLNRGRILTRNEILENVWDASINPFTNTVDVHIKRLRDKIEKPYNESFIETIHGVGYLVE
ncbi:DNA-binding response regulator [candidate division WWE3 bacterium CG_4_9_14_0_2_um_filter_35_11]|uniref:DNA-binding response regulator n=1 Tax=candidate division WWE3 bacterium CG_4_9_14_0_2_um_filter_35_11 TaxID=1975077 RepID=A0A2M8EM50_UNCKA|nr:MAG: DNA-binding response regulator [candidate division WWE3 bacterium CG10_big_fil_rev_8_21_14_0_10_35_32]PJC23812.1 MAG: DNA-binding response regulator [candidate division WWE3 bacterium CG_4_9_14_0_2_um_filter_35_11]